MNRDWAEGIASSIRAGLAHAPPAADGVLIALADQAAVTTEDLRRLAGAWRRIRSIIAAAQYAGSVGVPAIFPRWCFRELNELRGDRGAQLLLQRHVDRLVRLPMPSAELDIDRPEDLLALDGEHPSSSGRGTRSRASRCLLSRQQARHAETPEPPTCTARCTASSAAHSLAALRAPAARPARSDAPPTDAPARAIRRAVESEAFGRAQRRSPAKSVVADRAAVRARATASSGSTPA